MVQRKGTIIVCITMILIITMLLTSCDDITTEFSDNNFVKIELEDYRGEYNDYDGLYVKKIIKMTSLEKTDTLQYKLDLYFQYNDLSEGQQNADLLDNMKVSISDFNIVLIEQNASLYERGNYFEQNTIDAGSVKYYELVLDMREYACEYLRGDIYICVGCDLYNADEENRHIGYVYKVLFFLLKEVIMM